MTISVSIKSNTKDVLRRMKVLRSDITDKAQISALNRAGATTGTASLRMARTYFAGKGIKLKARYLRPKLQRKRATRYTKRYLLLAISGGIGKKTAGIPPKPPKEFEVSNPKRNWPIFRRKGKKRLPLARVSIAVSPAVIKSTIRALETVAKAAYLKNLEREIRFRVQRGY